MAPPAGRRAALTLALAALAGCARAGAPSATPRRIQQAGYLPVGGIEQWVTMRGRDAQSPLLFFIHGGPADAQSALTRVYAPYERDFVLVQWDQRGAGRTYGRIGRTTPDLTVERLIADGLELAGQLRRQFPNNRLILVGHSFGSLIAVEMVKRRPALFDAYVGTGQVSRWSDTVQFQFDLLVRDARRRGDAAALASMEAIGRPDPTNVQQYFSFTRPLRGLMVAADRDWLSGLKERYLAQPGFTDADLAALGEGMEFSAPALIEAQTHEDLFASAPALARPVYVIQGEEDLSTPTGPARAWFDALRAPRKEFVVIRSAGHFALVTHTAEFIAALRRLVGEQGRRQGRE